MVAAAKKKCIAKSVVRIRWGWFCLSYNGFFLGFHVRPAAGATFAYALAQSGAASDILGSGTMLDSARFRYFISQEVGVDVKSVHGDSELSAWSLTNLGGIPIQQYVQNNGRKDDWPEKKQQIFAAVKNSAYHIIDYQRVTHFAVGQALVRIVQAILRDSHSVLTVSVMLKGESGLDDICLSVPCLVSKDGVEKVLVANLSDAEQRALQHSASVLESSMKGVLE